LDLWILHSLLPSLLVLCTYLPYPP
jgi:hypothetical protein